MERDESRKRRSTVDSSELTGEAEDNAEAQRGRRFAEKRGCEETILEDGSLEGKERENGRCRKSGSYARGGDGAADSLGMIA